MHPFLGLWKKKEVLFRMNIKKNGVVYPFTFYLLLVVLTNTLTFITNDYLCAPSIREHRNYY